MTAAAVRVVVCDDVPELRILMRHGLEEDGDLAVVGEAGDVPELLDLLRKEGADAILLDLSLPGMDGLQGIPMIAKQAPRAAIVVFSGTSTDRAGRIALELGADDYLQKGADLAVVRAAIRDAARGRASAPSD